MIIQPDVFQSDAFPKEGVTLRYIVEEFVPSLCGGEDALQGMQTKDYKTPNAALEMFLLYHDEEPRSSSIFKECDRLHFPMRINISF
mmetsp:Transcript_6772/g.10459  ORF Transcript_6772/g.10459 Transcript_6772/m.10459 type:complete len:87 (+) Transcript_6772:271-531(+)